MTDQAVSSVRYAINLLPIKPVAAGASTGLIGYQLALHLTTLVVWIFSLFGLAVPVRVEEAIGGIFMAIITGALVGARQTQQPVKGEA